MQGHALREKLMSIHSLARRVISGVTWKNPIVTVFVHAVDPVDFIARSMNGRGHLPPYSIRVRSNGVRQDIGGAAFVAVGNQITALLREHASLGQDSKVLEIGCGCGRNAISLAAFLDDGNYTGMDIERVALGGAETSPLLRKKRFAFDLIDVLNDVFNPTGRYLATEYVLPYPDESFDVVFLISVFTHMLTDEVRNYAAQIARVLKPGGRCFLTAYLLDRDMEGQRQFPFRSQEHSFEDEAIPGIAVAYESSFLQSTFAANGMQISSGPLWGSVHGGMPQTPLDQDLIVFTKRD
jgi:SAM-dependent methyltransferase